MGRRAFALGAFSTAAFGCSSPPAPGPAPDSGSDALPSVPDPDLVSLHSFVGETPLAAGKVGGGLDARLRLDLSTLSRDGLDVGADAFFVRTERPDGLARLGEGEPKAITLGGLVEKPLALSAADLIASSRPMGVHVMECSGNTRDGAFGLISATSWAGVPLSEVLAKVVPTSADARVLVSGFDEHSQPSVGGHSTAGASWIFSRAELEQRGAFLATEMGGKPLLPDHGAPVRLVVPGYYGCTCIKWVDRIDWVADGAPATSQMKEFAARTHQVHAFEFARDYAPAAVQAAAMCTRAEHRRVKGAVRLFLRGIAWGGDSPARLLRLFLGAGGGDPVVVQTPAESKSSWGMWEYEGPALSPGRHTVRLRVEPIQTPQRRLDLDWYTRTLDVRG